MTAAAQPYAHHLEHLQDELRRLGGYFEKTDDWLPFAVVDGRLVTGQNPASSSEASRCSNSFRGR